MTKIQPGNAQHIGDRKDQQDAFGFSDIGDRDFLQHGGTLAVVADGMGGLSFGAEASRLAVGTLLDEYMAKSREETVFDALERSVLSANRAVYEMAYNKNAENNTGTTLVAAVVKEDALYWVSVGDSRLYLFRNDRMTQITNDHNYARELAQEVKKGSISQEDADSHPERHALTSHLGLQNLPEFDRNLRPFPLEPGDRLLLCSDGFYGSLTEAEMAASLAKNNPQECAEELVKKAIDKKISNQDNLTAAIMALDNKISMPETEKGPVKKKWEFLHLPVLILLILCMGGVYWYFHSKHDDQENQGEKSVLHEDQPDVDGKTGVDKFSEGEPLEEKYTDKYAEDPETTPSPEPVDDEKTTESESSVMEKTEKTQSPAVENMPDIETESKTSPPEHPASEAEKKPENEMSQPEKEKQEPDAAIIDQDDPSKIEEGVVEETDAKNTESGVDKNPNVEE